MNKTKSYCYQKYKSSSNNSCIIKEKNIVGKNLLEGTYFDGNGIPKMIGITKAEYLEYKKLQQENQQLKIQISAREEVTNKYKKIIEETRYYVEKECNDLLIGYFHNRFDTTEYYEKLLQILDKGESNE